MELNNFPSVITQITIKQIFENTKKIRAKMVDDAENEAGQTLLTMEEKHSSGEGM